MGTVSALPYTLSTNTKAVWSSAHEKSLSNDYPFDLSVPETPDQYIARTYLQFLWLPESIMPLHLLVASLRRVAFDPSSSSEEPHPLHSHLESLLLTARSASTKYNVDLPQILIDGGGAGEIEETMMWYALNHEKADEEDADGDIAALRTNEHSDIGPWVDEKWRKKWIEKMERREVQIQILLYMLKLSLPGPSPPPPESPSKRKRKRLYRMQPELSEPTLEDRLEQFMDKMSMWQLLAGLENGRTGPAGKGKGKVKGDEKDRDWMQVFCEDVVEALFKSTLPEYCALLRSKVFPSSLFSDVDSPVASPTGSRSSSPDALRPPSKSKSRTLSASSSRYPSPAPSTTSTTTMSRSRSTQSRTGSSTLATSSRTLARSRSRSISISLAQEQEDREREQMKKQKEKEKRTVNREVSMSRVLKPKPKPSNAKQEKEKEKERKKKEAQDVKGKEKGNDLGTTLVEETPVRPKLAVGGRAQSQSLFAASTTSIRSSTSQTLFASSSTSTGKKPQPQVEEEIWEMDATTAPNFVFLGATNGSLKDDRHGGSGTLGRLSKKRAFGEWSDEEEEEDALGLGGGMMEVTPSRPTRKRG